MFIQMDNENMKKEYEQLKQKVLEALMVSNPNGEPWRCRRFKELAEMVQFDEFIKRK